MARWSRSRLRNVGIGAVAIIGGSLLVVPAVSSAGEAPAPSRLAAVVPDRIVTVARSQGRSAFEFKPASGARDTPFSFVSTGGDVSVQRLGAGAQSALRAATGAPARSALVAAATATSYKTTLTVDSQNWTAWNKTISLWNRDTWRYVSVTNPQNSLSATVSLPPGNYYATAMYGIYDVNSYLLTKAFTVTSAAQTVHLAESSAKEVALRTDDSTARLTESAVWMSLPGGDLVGFAGGPLVRTFVTTASVAGTTLRVHDVLTRAGATALKPSPYRYDLMKSWPHPIPASPIATVKTASLAKTTTTVLGQGTNADGSYSTVPVTGEWTGAFLPTTVRFPATFTEYVTPGVSMSRLVDYGATQTLEPADRTLAAGTSAGETIGAGPLVPSRRFYDDDSRRDGDRLQLTENMTLGDAAGNRGYDYSATTSMTLSSGGRQLATSAGPSLSVMVPQALQTYRLEQTTTRKVAWSLLSTKTTSEWTFPSSGPSASKLPLMDLAMAASGLDQRNRAGSVPVRLTVTPSTRQISAANTVDKIEWSADDGATWAELPLTASGVGAEVSLQVPATAAFVSLRVTASNDQGGALRRTVLRALAGPATSGDESAGATAITNLKINGGKALVVGTPATDGFPVTITATFTATDPSGIASAGLSLWHGAYNTPDGGLASSARCTAVDATTSTCTADLYLWDARYSLGSNALAGVWQAEAWASAKDGTGFTDGHRAGGLAIKRATRLTADATPEPVTKGKTITVVGTLTRADWASWAFTPYAARTVTLQWAKPASTWAAVKTAKTDASGKLKTTVTAKADGYYRWTFSADATSDTVTSAADYVDVR